MFNESKNVRWRKLRSGWSPHTKLAGVLFLVWRIISRVSLCVLPSDASGFHLFSPALLSLFLTNLSLHFCFRVLIGCGFACTVDIKTSLERRCFLLQFFCLLRKSFAFALNSPVNAFSTSWAAARPNQSHWQLWLLRWMMLSTKAIDNTWYKRLHWYVQKSDVGVACAGSSVQRTSYGCAFWNIMRDRSSS